MSVEVDFDTRELVCASRRSEKLMRYSSDRPDTSSHHSKQETSVAGGQTATLSFVILGPSTYFQLLH
eukprot:scaffold3214_cov113-Cylindrotheca_fusiformis.AAC.3